MFPEKEISYNLRRKFLLELPETNSVTYGTNSLHFKACLIWNSLPNGTKICDNLNSFKLKRNGLVTVVAVFAANDYI